MLLFTSCLLNTALQHHLNYNLQVTESLHYELYKAEYTIYEQNHHFLPSTLPSPLLDSPLPASSPHSPPSDHRTSRGRQPLPPRQHRAVPTVTRSAEGSRLGARTRQGVDESL